MHKFYEKVLIVLRLVGSVELLLRSLVNRSWSVSRLSRNIDRLGLLVNRLLVNLLRRWAGLRLAWHRGVRFSFVAALAQANNETNGKNGAEGDPQPSEVSAAFRISRIGSYVFSERVVESAVVVADIQIIIPRALGNRRASRVLAIKGNIDR